MNEKEEMYEMLQKIGHHSLNIIEMVKNKDRAKDYYWEQAVRINKLSRKLYEILKKQH